MILTDHKIKDYGQKLVAPFAGDRVQAVGYDLTAKTFLLSSEQASSEVTLEPMASVFVQCEEEIALPADITSTIQLRNSRIRQGLILTAPRYYPGHCKPVYFRVTNFSGEAVRLAAASPRSSSSVSSTPSISRMTESSRTRRHLQGDPQNLIHSKRRRKRRLFFQWVYALNSGHSEPAIEGNGDIFKRA